MRHIPQPPSDDLPEAQGNRSFRGSAANWYRKYIGPDVYNIASLVGGATCLSVSPAIEQANHTAGVVVTMVSIGALSIGGANLVIGRDHHR